MRTFTNTPWTLKRAYQAICEGKGPWVALGNFMNNFFGDHPDQRMMLLQEPIEIPEEPTMEQRRWALFCAASVEYLSEKYGLTPPTWPSDPAYERLAEPWYMSPFAHRQPVRNRLERESPEPFKKRNIFCDDRIYANKYEIAEDLEKRRTA